MPPVLTSTIAMIAVSILTIGCGSMATQREILDRSKSEVAARENWADAAYLRVEQRPEQDTLRLSWKVRAGEYDQSDYPRYRGINLVPGTERELHFTPDGCLIGYFDRSGPCRNIGYADQGDRSAGPFLEK